MTSWRFFLGLTLVLTLMCGTPYLYAAGWVQDICFHTDGTAGIHLNATTTTDCKHIDLTPCTTLGVQVSCAETTGNDMQIDVDFVGGSYANSSYFAVPVLATGSALAQLIANRTTETTWSTYRVFEVPGIPVGTIRFTEDNSDDDVICRALLTCSW